MQIGVDLWFVSVSVSLFYLGTLSSRFSIWAQLAKQIHLLLILALPFLVGLRFTVFSLGHSQSQERPPVSTWAARAGGRECPLCFGKKCSMVEILPDSGSGVLDLRSGVWSSMSFLGGLRFLLCRSFQLRCFWILGFCAWSWFASSCLPTIKGCKVPFLPLWLGSLAFWRPRCSPLSVDPQERSLGAQPPQLYWWFQAGKHRGPKGVKLRPFLIKKTGLN